jgi:oligopeptide/dipeptide ABC transporter ATP-binding protein
VTPLLEIDDLYVTFRGRRLLPWTPRTEVLAVQGATLQVGRGETVGLVGESGSGKSTIGRAILKLLEPERGRIRLGDVDVTALARSQVRDFRRSVQVVFQDPVASLNPSMLVGQIVGEPLQLNLGLEGDARRARVAELLSQVGLDPAHAGRYPYEFSGGQRQRIAIARALASDPSLIVLDKPVSALDVSTQSQVINLLEELQRSTGVAYLMIAHDLAVVRHVCQRIVVMYRSRIMEEGPADRVCEEPAHPYTELLLASIPDPDPVVQREKKQRRRHLVAEAPSGSQPVTGCPFVARCPHAMEICHTEFPAETPLPGGGRVACHLYDSTGVRIDAAS